MIRKFIYFLCFPLFLIACSDTLVVTDEERPELPDIFPDYADCTIPPNISPLNFALTTDADEARALFTSGEKTWEVKARKGQFTINPRQWQQMLESAKGGQIEVKVVAKEKGKWIGYRPFSLHVAPDPVDPYIAYRLIEPGYELWNYMGLYQRNIESYTESPIMENKLTKGNCMNCHSFCMQNPEQMVFHMRGSLPGTYLMDGDKVEKLNTKTDQTISALVYPSWHPSGKYIAFSVNDTKQAFHMNDPNRIEVYDNESDVVVYDIQKHEIITCPALFAKDAFENFPTFSPDGKTLYFSTSDTCAMPEGYKQVKYSLCSIAFDPDNRKFGNQVDTLYNASTEGRSASFPRVSPDGKYLLYTLGDYGGFAIWHKDADLYMINLETEEHYPLEAANSDDAESYHSWSSNSRWILFSSRRIDGLYTRPFIAYIDENGKAHKAFVVPQKDTGFYHRFMKSYNVPEFITGKVKDNRRWFADVAKKGKGMDVKFGSKK